MFLSMVTDSIQAGSLGSSPVSGLWAVSSSSKFLKCAVPVGRILDRSMTGVEARTGRFAVLVFSVCEQFSSIRLILLMWRSVSSL